MTPMLAQVLLVWPWGAARPGVRPPRGARADAVVARGARVGRSLRSCRQAPPMGDVQLRASIAARWTGAGQGRQASTTAPRACTSTWTPATSARRAGGRARRAGDAHRLAARRARSAGPLPALAPRGAQRGAVRLQARGAALLGMAGELPLLWQQSRRAPPPMASCGTTSVRGHHEPGRVGRRSRRGLPRRARCRPPSAIALLPVAWRVEADMGWLSSHARAAASPARPSCERTSRRRSRCSSALLEVADVAVAAPPEALRTSRARAPRARPRSASG